MQKLLLVHHAHPWQMFPSSYQGAQGSYYKNQKYKIPAQMKFAITRRAG